ncbi:hypothetical protein [Fusobacterium necrophorum]|uniref:hypothetical protein n=1 Tax=Fusobacterium necrophorum TaxID=859 RepID=UPI00370ED781
MSKNDEKNTIIQNILKNYINIEKISVYKISKDNKISVKTIKKILENTSSNHSKKTLEKLYNLKGLNQEDKKEIKKIISQKNKVKNTDVHYSNVLRKMEVLMHENEILKEKVDFLTTDTNVNNDYFTNRKINAFYNELQSNSLLITKIWDFNEIILKKWADVKMLLDINQKEKTLKMEKGLKSISKSLKEISNYLDEISNAEKEEKFILAEIKDIEKEENKMNYDVVMESLDFTEIEKKLNALALVYGKTSKEILKAGILTNIALETLPNYQNYTYIFPKINRITGITQARMIKGVTDRIPKQLEKLFKFHDINKLNEDILETAENLVTATFDSIFKKSGKPLKKRYKEALDDADFLYINLRLAVKIVAEKLRSENVELTNMSLQYITDGIKKEKNNIVEKYIEAYIEGIPEKIEIARMNYREKMEKMLKDYYQSLNFSYEHTIKIGEEQNIVKALGKDFFDSVTSILLNGVSLKIKQNHSLQLKFIEF